MHTAVSEGVIMQTVIPMLTGTSNIPNSGDLLFTNMTSMTSIPTVIPNPDFFDGAHPNTVFTEMRKELSELVAPTKQSNVPVVPNCYLEAKGHGERANVARLQARTVSAYGTCAMHALQNYGKDEPVYDGNAYTMRSTFDAASGVLSLYAHHVTAPTDEGGQPAYHMTRLREFAMMGDSTTFIEGVTAFRNSRILTQEYRNSFIQEANARAQARALGTQAPVEENFSQAGQDASSPDDVADCEEHTGLAVTVSP
ncbi:hypothetical protein F4825DRAFT_423180 [Nemania diffusa]|nr:hypothetical protein F4825DRAFT_423180 [Nemania diffusa]